MSEGVMHTTIEEELKSGKSVTYFTLGVSMQPLLVERKTHVRIVPLDNAQVNDILLYIRKNGSYVLHRLMKQDEQFFYMRGDNTYGFERIEKSQAMGVVTCIYKSGRSIDVKQNKGYQFYVIIWRIFYPIRYFLWRCRGIKRLIKIGKK